ncbi:hypothetical protein D6F12_01830 [Salmonella enterica]|nr:hypothetical protein [Salmonella enterica subsp. enterica serovar Enteritidis]EAS3777300.1 hypothetical protein [Salmonella enterica]
MLVGILKNLLLTYLLVISELLTHTVLFHKRFKMIEHELNTKRLRSIKLQFPQNLIFNELIDCMFVMLNSEQAKYINEKIAFTPDTWIYQTTIDVLNSLMNKEQIFSSTKSLRYSTTMSSYILNSRRKGIYSEKRSIASLTSN